MAKMVVRLEAVKRRDIAGRGRHNSRTGYVPERIDTPCGKLQLEFYQAYADAGLDLERGESVLTRQARHKTFQQHALDMDLEAKGEETEATLLLLDARDAKQKAWDNFEKASEAYRSALWKTFDDYKNDSERAIEDAAYGRLVEAVAPSRRWPR